MSDSESYRTNELLAQIHEAVVEGVGVLRGIEGMLDSICENTSNTDESATAIAFNTHGIIAQLRAWRQRRRLAIDLVEKIKRDDAESAAKEWRLWDLP
jgi:hypothetical protein